MLWVECEALTYLFLSVSGLFWFKTKTKEAEISDILVLLI